MEKDREIKDKIIEICKKKNIVYKQIGDILNLSYKDSLEFTINLSNETRYISRTENKVTNLKLYIRYLINTGKPKPSSTIAYSSEKEGAELRIKRCQDNIEYDKEVYEKLVINNIEIELQSDKKIIKTIKTIEELIDILFS